MRFKAFKSGILLLLFTLKLGDVEAEKNEPKPLVKGWNWVGHGFTLIEMNSAIKQRKISNVP